MNGFTVYNNSAGMSTLKQAVQKYANTSTPILTNPVTITNGSNTEVLDMSHTVGSVTFPLPNNAPTSGVLVCDGTTSYWQQGVDGQILVSQNSGPPIFSTTVGPDLYLRTSVAGDSTTCQIKCTSIWGAPYVFQVPDTPAISKSVLINDPTARGSLWLATRAGKALTGNQSNGNPQFDNTLLAPITVLPTLGSTVYCNILAPTISNDPQPEFQLPYNNPSSNCVLISDGTATSWVGTTTVGSFLVAQTSGSPAFSNTIHSPLNILAGDNVSTTSLIATANTTFYLPSNNAVANSTLVSNGTTTLWVGTATAGRMLVSQSSGSPAYSNTVQGPLHILASDGSPTSLVIPSGTGPQVFNLPSNVPNPGNALLVADSVSASRWLNNGSTANTVARASSTGVLQFAPASGPRVTYNTASLVGFPQLVPGTTYTLCTTTITLRGPANSGTLTAAGTVDFLTSNIAGSSIRYFANVDASGTGVGQGTSHATGGLPNNNVQAGFGFYDYITGLPTEQTLTVSLQMLCVSGAVTLAGRASICCTDCTQ